MDFINLLIIILALSRTPITITSEPEKKKRNSTTKFYTNFALSSQKVAFPPLRQLGEYMSTDSKDYKLICRTCKRLSEHRTCCFNYTCVDLSIDRFNCGSCGLICNLGTRCCGGICVDIKKDNENCGKCYNKLGFREVKQLLVTGPLGNYYVVEGDGGIRTLQHLLSCKFNILNLYAIDAGEVDVDAPNIIHHSQITYSASLSIVSVDDTPVQVGVINIATDCDSSDKIQVIEPHSGDYDSQEFEVFRKERMKDIDEKFEMYKTLDYGMTFKDIKEARRVVGLYSMANMNALKVLKSDTKRVRYICEEEGCSFVCYMLEMEKVKGSG
ncbi:hypothetical protein HAX54_047391 [Datura stramonium]|uniref:Transposase MuDR plant domain-containing protein n=1 Tax=Datura stramonium TaxID=4076 RepID=A0ABS8SSD0_DATST|nr:hypothetical protein [Datura stramonium]